MRGGRGSGKSFTAAKMAAIWGAVESLRILCTREYQNSIKESFHAELKNAILSCPWLSTQYDVGIDYLRHKHNGTEFMFKGLRHNIDAVKSIAQIDLVIVEEAETIPARSWQDLVPTIRAAGSEFWIIYNPRNRDSWVAKSFDGKEMPPRAKVVDISHGDNPWFSKELDEQRLHDRKFMDPALYAHVWEGAYYEQSDAQVLAGKWRVDSFNMDEFGNKRMGPRYLPDGPYYGSDFGFAVDPTTLVRFWIWENKLWIDYEAFGVGVDIIDTPALYDKVPGSRKHVIRADCARPETISHIKRQGYNIRAADKWPGSVEDGIAWIRSFEEIIIHERCVNMQEEAAKWSYKIDRLTGDVMPKLADGWDHGFDALRYGAAPMIRASKGGGISVSSIL